MVLVTGGTGLVGAHLLLHLAESEEKIVAIYRSVKSLEKPKALFVQFKKENLFSRIQWIKADILDIPTLEIAFQKIDYVYHCAAIVSFDPKDESKLRKVNIEGTANIVNFCIDKKVKKLCHVSSIAALGDLKEHETIVTEEMEWNAEVLHSDYAITKYGAEMEVWRGQQEGLQVIIINPGVILGSTLWKTTSGEIFAKIKNQFPFYSQGSTGYIGVFDVVNIMSLLMKSDIVGERFSLVSENLSFKKIVFLVADKMNVKKPSFEVKPWMTALFWRIDWFFSTFFRTKRNLSRITAQSIHSKEIISNDKIKNALKYDFQSMDTVVANLLSKN